MCIKDIHIWYVYKRHRLDLGTNADWKWGAEKCISSFILLQVVDLVHVNVWQKPLQYCKVISLQLIKINGKWKKSVFNANGHQKKARLAKFISERIDFKIKPIIRD